MELQRVVGLADEMWRVMKPEDKKVYQDQAKRLGEGHMKKRALYEGILVEYKKLLESIGLPGEINSLHSCLHTSGESILLPCLVVCMVHFLGQKPSQYPMISICIGHLLLRISDLVKGHDSVIL